MKIAVPYENGMVFQHFGHTAEFKFYEVENGQVTASEVVSTNGQGHGALVGFLAQHNANVVFCGGIGPGADDVLACGISAYCAIADGPMSLERAIAGAAALLEAAAARQARFLKAGTILNDV